MQPIPLLCWQVGRLPADSDIAVFYATCCCLLHTHTSTHMHADRHKCTHISAHACTQRWTRAGIRHTMYSHTHPCTQTHAYMHIYVSTEMHKYALTQTQRYTCSHLHTHVWAHIMQARTQHKLRFHCYSSLWQFSLSAFANEPMKIWGRDGEVIEDWQTHTVLVVPRLHFQ